MPCAWSLPERRGTLKCRLGRVNGGPGPRLDDLADEVVRFCTDDPRPHEIARLRAASQVRAPVDLGRLTARSPHETAARIPALDENLDGAPAVGSCTTSRHARLDRHHAFPALGLHGLGHLAG